MAVVSFSESPVRGRSSVAIYNPTGDSTPRKRASVFDLTTDNSGPVFVRCNQCDNTRVAEDNPHYNKVAIDCSRCKETHSLWTFIRFATPEEIATLPRSKSRSVQKEISPESEPEVLQKIEEEIEPAHEPGPDKEPEPVVEHEPVMEPEPVIEPEAVKEPEPVMEPEPVEEPEPVKQPKLVILRCKECGYFLISSVNLEDGSQPIFCPQCMQSHKNWEYIRDANLDDNENDLNSKRYVVHCKACDGLFISKFDPRVYNGLIECPLCLKKHSGYEYIRDALSGETNEDLIPKLLVIKCKECGRLRISSIDPRKEPDALIECVGCGKSHNNWEYVRDAADGEQDSDLNPVLSNIPVLTPGEPIVEKIPEKNNEKKPEPSEKTIEKKADKCNCIVF